jgi:hypothetical protein
MTKLKKLHVRILKIMKRGEKFNVNDNIYDYWRLLPFEMIVKYVFITQQYFNENHDVPRMHCYLTREARNQPLVMPRASNCFGERIFKYVVPRIWNEIPVNLRNLNNKNIVKNKIKKWLLSEIK